MMTSAPPIEVIENAVSSATEVVWILDGETRQRERRRAQLLDRHWTMLGVSVAVIALALALQLNPAGRVSASWLPLESLPPLCGSRAIFGINCPGCGLTRSFVALAAGDVVESVRLHRVGWLLAMAVVLQIPYRLWGLQEIRRGVLADRVWPAWCGHALIAALLLNWLFNLAVGG
jgi:hypothetical protein